MIAIAAALVRWVTFVAIAVIVGAIVFRGGVLARVRWSETARILASRQAAQFGALSAMTLFVAGIARLVVQVAELRAPGESWHVPAHLMLTATLWGKAWMLQMGASLVIAIALALAARRRATERPWWWLAASGALALCVTPALSGHAAGSMEMATQAIIADTLHVLGAGAWLGTLLVVLAVALPATRVAGSSAPVLPIVRAFSPIALTSAGVILASGVFAAWLHMDQPSSLWLTAYGRVLLLKVALFLVIAAVGAYNWRRVTPRLELAAGVDTLQRSAGVEVALGALLFAATAVLVATPLPGE